MKRLVKEVATGCICLMLLVYYSKKKLPDSNVKNLPNKVVLEWNKVSGNVSGWESKLHYRF